MKMSLNKYINRKIARALAEFDLLNDGDNILVGLSGGKDSTFLLYVLKVLQGNLGKNYSLGAVTVKPFFTDLTEKNYNNIKKLCNKLDIEHYFTEIKTDKYKNKKEIMNNPCSYCAHFRKGAIVDLMNDLDYNKIAFGHHYDDAIETFLISLFYSGQLKTFPPLRHLSDNNIKIIRPLVYVREKQIIDIYNKLAIEPVDISCPYESKTKRNKIKNMLSNFEDKKQVFYNLASAIRNNQNIELWPAKDNEEKLREKVTKLWNNSS